MAVLFCMAVNDNEQILRGGVGLINASSEVDCDEWRRYVEALKPGENYPGIRFSQWISSAPAMMMKIHTIFSELV